VTERADDRDAVTAVDDVVAVGRCNTEIGGSAMPLRCASAMRSQRARTSSLAGLKLASNAIVGSSVPTTAASSITRSRAVPHGSVARASSDLGELRPLRPPGSQRAARAAIWARRARAKSSWASTRGNPVELWCMDRR
jgi:hypothetical protein